MQVAIGLRKLPLVTCQKIFYFDHMFQGSSLCKFPMQVAIGHMSKGILLSSHVSREFLIQVACRHMSKEILL